MTQKTVRIATELFSNYWSGMTPYSPVSTSRGQDPNCKDPAAYYGNSSADVLLFSATLTAIATKIDGRSRSSTDQPIRRIRHRQGRVDPPEARTSRSRPIHGYLERSSQVIGFWRMVDWAARPTTARARTRRGQNSKWFSPLGRKTTGGLFHIANTELGNWFLSCPMRSKS